MNAKLDGTIPRLARRARVAGTGEDRCVSEMHLRQSASSKLKRILVPIDFSPESIKALHYAHSFAEKFGATLCLVNVVETTSSVNDLKHVPIVSSDETRVDNAKSKLIQLAQNQIDALIPVNPQVRIGTPFQEIVNVAETLEADLIIIATHGYTGLKHVLLGSTAERVVRHAPCPVLVVRQWESDFV